MSYAPSMDFLGLVRQTAGGARTVRMPGLDFTVAALARAGLIGLSVSQSPPITNQAVTAWFKPSVQSWAGEGALYLWNSVDGQYEFATPALWAALFAAAAAAAGSAVQDVNVSGPVAVNPLASVVRVLNVGAPVVLTMPLASVKVGSVLVSDWANLAGTNAIRINLSGGDVFPNGVTSWQINGDGGSVSLRPVPGGYVL